MSERMPVLRVEVVMTADSALLGIIREALGALIVRAPPPLSADDGGPGVGAEPHASAPGPAVDEEQYPTLAATLAGASREPRPRVWTEARNAALREGWPAGMPTRDLLAQLAALPGAPMAGVRSVREQARYLGLRGRSVVGAPVSVWTPERVALLREGWPAGDTVDALLAAVAALPGAPIRSPVALVQQVKKLGLRRARAPAAPPVVKQSLTAAPAASVAPAPASRAGAERVAANLAPLSTSSRPSYDWAGEYLRDGRVLCDAARVAAYCARYDVRPAGDMIAVNAHRTSRAWPPMSLCEPGLLPAGAEYPVRA